MKKLITPIFQSRPMNYLIMLLPFLLPLSACTPSASGETAGLPQEYTFYLGTEFLSHNFTALDPQTLEETASKKDVNPGTFSTRNGLVFAVEYDQESAVPDTQHTWIVVKNPPSAKEQARFHPPAAGFLTGLSADGSRLLWQVEPETPGTYPPPVEWLVLNAGDGQVIAHIKDDANACFRQSALFDPNGRFVYCAVDPDLNSIGRPKPLRIAAYDADTESLSATVELLDIMIGGAPINHDQGDQVYEFYEPGLALSPDGSLLAVVSAESEAITLLSLPDLSLNKTISLASSISFLDLFATTAEAKGLMDGTISSAQFSPDGVLLYLYYQVIRAHPDEEPLGKRGLGLVDLDKGALIATALEEFQIQWLKPAPDGSLYVFGTSTADLMPYEIRPDSPSTLWRLDGQTLAVLASRDFTGFRAGRIVFLD